MDWSQNDRIALLLSICVGMVLAVPVGYMVAGQRFPFDYWVSTPGHGVEWWVLAGGMVGAALFIVRRLSRERS